MIQCFTYFNIRIRVKSKKQQKLNGGLEFYFLAYYQVQFTDISMHSDMDIYIRVKYNNVIDSYDVLLKVQHHFYLLITATGIRLCKCLTEWMEWMEPNFRICKFQSIAKLEISFTHIISYYNSLFETTLIRCTFYYILVFVENIGLMLFWFKKAIKMIGIVCLHLQLNSFAFIGLSFLVSIHLKLIRILFFQTLYYLIIHPNKRLKLWQKVQNDSNSVKKVKRFEWMSNL